MATQKIQRTERGATAILIALSMVALMGVVGIVMDGGFGFSDRRQTQNAADAAALAGAQKVNEKLLGQSVTVADVVNAVTSYGGTTNKANQTALCWFINERGNPIDAMNAEYPAPNENTAPQCGTLVTIPSAAAGVRVVTADIQSTNFIKAVGVNSFTAGGTAKAQAQKYTPTSGEAPIMVCAIGPGDTRTTGGGLYIQQYTAGTVIPILLPNTDTVNPAAVGVEYWLKGVEVKNTCTGASNMKGVVLDGQFPIPGNWDHTTGNHSGPIRTIINGGCNGETVGCLMALPLCYANTASGGDFWCVQFGVFKITFTDSNSVRGTFERGGTISGGNGGGLPAAGDLRVVKLSQ